MCASCCGVGATSAWRSEKHTTPLESGIRFGPVGRAGEPAPLEVFGCAEVFASGLGFVPQP